MLQKITNFVNFNYIKLYIIVLFIKPPTSLGER